MTNDDLKDLEIIDFKGVTDGQGKAVPYSKEVAEELKQVILTPLTIGDLKRDLMEHRKQMLLEALAQAAKRSDAVTKDLKTIQTLVELYSRAVEKYATHLTGGEP